MGTVSVQLGLLAVAKDRTNADLADLETAVARATNAGHRVMVREVVGDSEAAIRLMLERWIADPAIDVILVVGGDSDAVSNALRPLIGHMLPGFTDLFRLLFFQEVGASAMLSAAEAARCTDTFVFVMPGAVGPAMDQLILPQFDPTTKKNLVGQMPRLRAERENAPEPAAEEGSAGHGVPREVPPEKTQGGSGVSARLPAMPAPRREQKRTGANVIARNPKPADPPTKPIDVAKLEQQIAASQAKEDVTRRTDLQKLLPRVPPGADDLDDDGDGDDVTHADIIAAPPAKPFTVPAVAKPAPAPIARITPVPASVKPTTPVVVPKVHLDRTVPADRITPLPEGVTPASPSPIGKTPLPSIAKPAATSTPVETKTSPVVKPIDAMLDAKRAQATPGDIKAKPPDPETVRFETVTPPPMATPAPVTIQPRKRESGEAKPIAKPVSDEAVTKARAVVEEPPATAEEAPTTAKPSPRASGSIGVLSDADIEPVDADSESADLDEIRAAATAQSDEAPTVSRAEPVRVKQPTPPPVTKVTTVPPAPSPAPRTRPPTAPPKPTAPAATASATDGPRERPATTPPPPRTTSELPRGTFNYPVQQRGMHWALKVLLVLIVLGAGFGGFVFFFRNELTGGTDQAAKANEGSANEIDAAVVASVEVDAAVDVDAASDDEPEIEMTPAPEPRSTPRQTREKPPRGERPPKNPPPEKATIDAGTALPAPPTGPSNTPAGTSDDDCDETACVLSKYEKPCCAKYKPAESTDLTPRLGGVPETLDKTMVRAGVNGVKPKVQKCGEKIAVKGTVKIAMEVSPDGAVTGASVADAPDAALGECVAAAMKLAKFGKSVNGGSFTYPFLF